MKLIALILALCAFATPAFAQDAPKETTYDRVMRTKTIRCGYVVLPPHIIKDPNTEIMSGIIYDIMEESAKLLDLKIDWSEEVGFATMNTGLQTGRYDAICFNYWQNPADGRLGYIGFSTPLYYMPVGAFVRADDTRFDKDMTALNDPGVRISSSDGQISTLIVQQDFPKAQVVTLPNMTDVAQNFMEISAGKADVTFLSLRDGYKFDKANPGQIKNITARQPVRVFASVIAIPQDDRKFEIMLNTAFSQLINGGTVDRILKRYEEYPGAIFPVAKPYEVK
jgi:polar amino acid transport system substrate-binding protein